MHSPEHPETPLAITRPTQLVIPQQADSDATLLDLWLHGRSHHTQRAYRADAERFLESVGMSLHEVGLADLQVFATTLESSGLEPSSQHRNLSAVKSLFAFGHRLGYLPFDSAWALRLPGLRNKLSERILDEGEVQKMLALEPMPRNQVLLTLLYAAGLRVSELCGLKWRDLQPRDGGGQITVQGKGEKTRTILLPESVTNKLVGLHSDAVDEAPMFRSRKKGPLQPTQIWRIVGRAAERAGINKAVSCHWLRHAHASHSLERGASISLVQATLGHASVATTGRYLHARPCDSSSKYLPL